MRLEDEVFQLRQRVLKLERQVAFLLNRLDLTYHEAPESVPSEILDLVRHGRKIQAIKRYREMTGSSLKAAKALIESLL